MGSRKIYVVSALARHATHSAEAAFQTGRIDGFENLKTAAVRFRNGPGER